MLHKAMFLLGMLAALCSMLTVWPEVRLCDQIVIQEQRNLFDLMQNRINDWYLMSSEERQAHYQKLCTFRTEADMRAYLQGHQQKLSARGAH